MTTSLRWGAAALTCLIFLGCGSDGPQNLGDTPALLGSELSHYTAVWEGYAEAHTFADGSDKIRLAIEPDGAGTLELGDSPAPEEFFVDLTVRSESPDRAYLSWIPRPGFNYPFEAARVESRRIRLAADAWTPFRPWCAQFEPLESSLGGYLCAVNRGYSVAFDEEAGMWTCTELDEEGAEGDRFDCSELACLQICNCDAERCDASPPGANEYLFDGALEAQGEELVGTLIAEERITVRLTRM